MSLYIQSEACSQIRTVWGIQSAGRALDAQWKRQGIQWKMARGSERQRTWLKKFSSRKCFSLPDLGTHQKSSKSLFSQISNHLWLVILLFWAVTQSSEKERESCRLFLFLSEPSLKLTSTPKQGKNTSLQPSEPEQSQAKQGAGRWESWSGDFVFY